MLWQVVPLAREQLGPRRCGTCFEGVRLATVATAGPTRGEGGRRRSGAQGEQRSPGDQAGLNPSGHRIGRPGGTFHGLRLMPAWVTGYVRAGPIDRGYWSLIGELHSGVCRSDTNAWSSRPKPVILGACRPRPATRASLFAAPCGA